MQVLTKKSAFINQNSRVPKYRQVVNTILWEIDQGIFKPGNRLPSLSETSAEYYLSRDTIEKAYRELSQRGVISSVPGKGYYVNSRPEKAVLKVMMILNKLSYYKSQVYEAFNEEIGPKATTTIFIHDYQPRRFQSFILDNLGFFDYYVVMPHFSGEKEVVLQAMEKIPSCKLILLDQDLQGINGNYGLIYQDFAKDLDHTLRRNLYRLNKYKKLFLVFNEEENHLLELKKGFIDFCQRIGIPHEVVNRFEPHTMEKGNAYLVIRENDLVNLIKACQRGHWNLGSDVGILSYNDSPLKEVLAEGISVITTDHKNMGRKAARMIIDQKREKIHNRFSFIDRRSF